MFLQFYRLREQPFGVTPNPRYLYHGPAHREALASLIYGIEADLGFAALIAEPGMGKTTLLYYLLERFRSSARTAFVFQTQCDRLELLRYLANELEVPAEEMDAVVLNDRIREVLVQEARAGRRVIVIIDEAQNLTEDALEAVRLLSDFETPDSKLMHIILSGQPELAEKLARPNMAQLLQRIAMLNRLSPFGDPEQISHYLAYRLQVAGYAGPPLFTPDAIDLISTASKGIPRQINRICFNALSLGCAMQKRKIDGAIIREVLTDLDVATWLTRPGAGNSSAGPSPDDEPVSRKPLKFSAETPDADVAARDPLIAGAPLAPVSSPAPSQIRMGASNIPLVRPQPPLTDGALALSSPPAVAPESVRAAMRSRPSSGAQARPAPVPPNHSRATRTAVRSTAPAVNGARPALKVQAPSKAQSVPAVRRPNGQPEQSTSIRMVLLCALGVPLLLFAAWLYMEKLQLLPGLHQPAAVEQSTPLDQGSGTDADHGTSVTLPPPADSGAPQKPKKTSPAPRSEIRPPHVSPLQTGVGRSAQTARAGTGARQVYEVRPSESMAQIVVSFDTDRPQTEQD